MSAPPRAYRNPRISPDGTRVAVTIDELGSQDWLLDIGRGTLTRLTFEGSYNGGTAWTPDSKRITFGSDRAGPRNLFWKLADGSGGTERLTTTDGFQQVASGWSPDGQTLAFEQNKSSGGFDLFVFRLVDRKLMAADTKTKPTFSAGSPKMLFEGHYGTYNTMPDYDVTPDGRRFLFTKAGQDSRAEINVVVNWTEELKQKIATGSK